MGERLRTDAARTRQGNGPPVLAVADEAEVVAAVLDRDEVDVAYAQDPRRSVGAATGAAREHADEASRETGSDPSPNRPAAPPQRIVTHVPESTLATMTFTGFPAEAFDFYVRLGMDNSRPFWQANKSVYDTQVKAPLLAALEELEAYGPFQIFRPYRDVRFAKDKTPYKENAGAYGEGEGGTGYYLALNATSLFAGAGYYGFAADQMERFRTAVDADGTGGDLAARVAAMEKKGFTVGAISELKTAPRGYPKDHPRIALLRRKGLFVGKEWPVAKWMHTKAAVGKVRDVWEAARHVTDWLDAHVGPSTLPPEDSWR